MDLNPVYPAFDPHSDLFPDLSLTEIWKHWLNLKANRLNLIVMLTITFVFLRTLHHTPAKLPPSIGTQDRSTCRAMAISPRGLVSFALYTMPLQCGPIS